MGKCRSFFFSVCFVCVMVFKVFQPFNRINSQTNHKQYEQKNGLKWEKNEICKSYLYLEAYTERCNRIVVVTALHLQIINKCSHIFFSLSSHLKSTKQIPLLKHLSKKKKQHNRREKKTIDRIVCRGISVLIENGIRKIIITHALPHTIDSID